jgi:hypothetical protein
MRHCLVLRRASIATVLALTFATLAPRLAATNEVQVGGSARGLVIHDAEETLRDYCVRDAAGVLWLELPGGARFELVTSIDDPVILNHGDGAFHPFDATEVRRAVNEVRFPLEGIRADVFLLPYPRREGLDSAAGRELILLSPGVRAIERAQQHCEVTHELGHVVQYALMPDDHLDFWSRYRRLRGIADEAVYCASSNHANRPHEIFAEDFRALFGGALAVQTGTIENSDIPSPLSVGGLDRFLLSLSGASAAGLDFAASANPARGTLRFAQTGGSPRPVDLFDVSGRRVATLDPHAAGGVVEWNWNGSDDAGRRFTGVVLARIRGSARAAIKVTMLQ